MIGTNILLLLSLLLGAGASASDNFNPRDYPKQVAACKAVNRAEGKDVDIEIHYVDINPKAEKTLLMVHGWPSLWSSWKYQIQEFKFCTAKNDYRLLIPDLRGFGSSTHPGDVKSSGNMADMVSDMICVLDNAKVETAICVGHDWGAQICYEAGRTRPDVFEAVVGVAIPYIPAAGPFMPTEALLEHLPRLSYQLFFDKKTSDAVDELAKDIRRTLRGTLRTADSAPPDAFLTHTDSFLKGWDDTEEIDPIPFFSPDEEDYWVEQYGIQAFKNTLQFYTDENRHASWKIANEQGNHSIPQPVLSVLPTKDPVADWVLAAKLLRSADYLPNLTTETLHGAHWVHMENPVEFNKIMRAWLDGLSDHKERSRDEL
ncbi:hypothetical protein EW146_g3260 [Bondarzewia mesenterica]|uniref:AB hydrolase-1 domain-containing protein n=1 Tax=Bondarzewia mesenterica TaxID=1095465 RepID=A0A4S4LYK9_9AGAM|nr:hypothetical protein EW146_g3260 [Bondarzewia mesenterica]